jgi:hypothetical protein
MAGAAELVEGIVDVIAPLLADDRLPHLVDPGGSPLHHQRFRPSRWEDSLPGGAMRLLMARRRSTRWFLRER